MSNKTFKEINIDGLVPFAAGGTAECYRLGDDKILKLHYPGYSVEQTVREKENAVTALISDIPAVISYELVKVDDRIGVVFESIDAPDISHVIKKDESRIRDLARQFADLAKSIHRNTDDRNLFPKATRFIRASVDRLDYVSDAAKARMIKTLDDLDTYDNFIHGDFHTNNALVTKDGLILVDMVGFCKGCPSFDIASTYFSFFSSPEAYSGGVNEFNGLDLKTRVEFWDAFKDAYFGPGDSELLRILPEVVLLKRLNFESSFGRKFSQSYCMKIREDVIDFYEKGNKCVL